MASHDLVSRIRYESVPGFFIQSDPSTVPSPHPPAFGLKACTSLTYWKDFEDRIGQLQQSAPRGTRYVVCWLGRHGQGWHNVAVDKHGPKAWDEYWSKQNGDNEITWGPDARLTPLGESQAKAVNDLWKLELSRPDDPVPLPTKMFTSPLARALATAGITFKDIAILPRDKDMSHVTNPLVMEKLRESLAPYTSDKRSTKTEIQNLYPAFQIEDEFSEVDELWSETVSESGSHFNARVRAVLGNIMGNIVTKSDTFISITTHSGVAAEILRIINHRSYPLPAGGVIPVVIKVITQCQ
ncbi:phosphomutase PMU1 [Ceratobasidium theobromae]|uniref:Phosphomutase PMU1 n=1 Tax=Ceratobasidium theobromae TaxID=1582974 RepID=A0A5N5QA57_9AGAM|nr:phosphomutase PMU1 [Ceratobasidium theobromae]